MNATFRAEKPDDIVFTATFTMSLKEWKLLRDRCSEEWPGWDFRKAIREIVSEAEQTYWAKPKGDAT